jgi:hypothetical protein
MVGFDCAILFDDTSDKIKRLVLHGIRTNEPLKGISTLVVEPNILNLEFSPHKVFLCHDLPASPVRMTEVKPALVEPQLPTVKFGARRSILEAATPYERAVHNGSRRLSAVSTWQ